MNYSPTRRSAEKPQRVELRFIPQAGPQTAFIHSPCTITVLGGARGGGKTHGSLGDFWVHAEMYGQDARGLMVRKTREDLKDTIDTGSMMYGRAAKYHEKGNYFQFRNGAKLFCAYLESDDDAANYQGWNLTRVYIEELTQFATSSPVLKLLGTLRSVAGVPCRMKCTCNPGGPGHHWVKSMFIDHGPYVVHTDPRSKITMVFIPARITDNPMLMLTDPHYVDRLKAVGNDELVRAWLEGDWNVVIGSFFPEFTLARHVIRPFEIPPHWTRFRAMDWGSAHPFCVSWYAVAQDDTEHDYRTIPRGALVNYREWYGMKTGEPNVGLKLTAEVVALGIVSRETLANKSREKIAYGVLDPAAWAVTSGPSIAEKLITGKVNFRRADNTRVVQSHARKMGGWDQVRSRLQGPDYKPDEGIIGPPMLFFFDTCPHIIRTLPIMVADEHNLEDVDTDLEDHAVDTLRYGCMSRPYLARVVSAQSQNQFLVSNAFGLDKLE